MAWEEQMAELRSEYEQLLYFSVPKLLHLYQNLVAPQPSPESIMHDVGFLFENTPSVQAQLKQTVQVGLQCNYMHSTAGLVLFPVIHIHVHVCTHK